MGKSQRTMGQDAERRARDALRRVWPDARRGHGQSDGAHQADIENVPLAVEVKEWKTWPSVEKAIDQCARDAKKRNDVRPQCVVHRRKNSKPDLRTEWRITFALSEFVRFVEQMRGGL